MGGRRSRSQGRARRLVAEQRARREGRSSRSGGDDVALAPRRAAGRVVDRVLERRVSGVAAIRAGATRLWERAAFAVVATWATVTIVAIVVVAPAWAWWTGAL